MATVSEKVQVRADRERVFDAYVNHIDEWWLRQGTYRYSYAPESTEPGHIRFDAGPDGRLYEEFGDGTIHEIGRITLWDPPNEFAYTWVDSSWPDATTVHVSFVEDGEQTTVMVTHSGLPADAAEGYTVGWRELLAHFVEWKG